MRDTFFLETRLSLAFQGYSFKHLNYYRKYIEVNRFDGLCLPTRCFNTEQTIGLLLKFREIGVRNQLPTAGLCPWAVIREFVDEEAEIFRFRPPFYFLPKTGDMSFPKKVLDDVSDIIGSSGAYCFCRVSVFSLLGHKREVPRYRVMSLFRNATPDGIEYLHVLVVEDSLIFSWAQIVSMAN